jgi:cytochrome P450
MTAAPELELADQIVMSLLSDEGQADPYPVYAQLREVAPMHFSEMLGGHILTRFEDCKEVLSNPDHRAVDALWSDANMPGWREHPATAFMARALLGLNPPDHTRLRRLINGVFTARRIELLLPTIERTVDELLDGLAESGADGSAVDFQATVAFPLPVSIIGDLVGVPREDQAQFRKIVHDATLVFDPMASEESVALADTATVMGCQYFEDLIAERRADRRDDLISALITAADNDAEAITDDELVALLVFLFAAGFQTTMGLVGNGIHALLTHPDQLALLRADPSLMPQAVEEILRWDSPAQAARRIAGTSKVGGVQLRPGSMVMTMQGAANRDPAVFADPNRFDILRTDGRHLSFSAGAHFCLGGPLARLQTGVLLQRVFERFPDLALAGSGVRRRILTMRGFQIMPVTIGKGAVADAS